MIWNRRLAGLARVTGTRWTIGSCINVAEGEVGLDTYAVRNWTGWYRHRTLAMFADAVLGVIHAGREIGGRAGADMIPLTVPELPQPASGDCLALELTTATGRS